MEIKANQSTENRPEGDRILDARSVFIDIPGFIQQLKSEKSWEKNDRNGITVFKSEDITMVISAMKAGAAIQNRINGFLTLLVLEGSIAVNTEGIDKELYKDQAFVFHSGTELSFRAVSDAVVMLTTYNKH